MWNAIRLEPAMSERRLLLLSPYRLPTHHQIHLNEDEMAAWLNGFVALWHPALLFGANEAPKVDSPYDHEMPLAGHVFAVAEAPPLFQPDDWGYRVQNAGAARFTATADRAATLANLRAAVEEAANGDAEEGRATFGTPEIRTLLDLPIEKVRPFWGIGFGYLMIESLFDAMEHEHLLAVEDFWSDLQQAIAALLRPDGGEEADTHLKAAAGRLLAAREVLYPIAVHVLDIFELSPNRLDAPLPESFALGMPLNILATGQTLEKLAAENPDACRRFREKLNADIQPPALEFVGGHYREREDALMPLESQLWNFSRGTTCAKQIIGAEVETYGRKRTALHPQTPQLLQFCGLRHALHMSFDSAVIPNHHATVANWSSLDGKSIDAFTRMPLKAHQAQTFFNLVYSLHQSITQDTAPTLALIHEGEAASPLYADWLELTRLGPVLGQWTTFGRYFGDVLAGEYVGASSPDDFFADYLEERINQHRSDPLSAFGRHARVRRRIDSAYALAAIHRGLVTPAESDRQDALRLQQIEDALETEGLDGIADAPSASLTELEAMERTWAERLAARLQARAADNQPGYLIINPCSFPRRVALELDPVDGPFPIEGPVKAAQFDTDHLRVVVEVQGLGFAWIPRGGQPGSSQPKPRLRLAEEFVVRNEFFEAEIDPATGGLRCLRDLKTRVARIGQQLVYNPGSRMEARNLRVTVNGSALGEIISEGVLLNEQNEEIASFRQRFRAWMSRPMLDMRIEIHPKQQATGYPWHSYFGSRFAWRDDRSAIMRGVNGSSNQTTHTRPVTPDYLDIHLGKHSTLIFPGGLPFHQRHGARMVDVILIPEREECRVFDIGLALDRDNPMQTAVGFVSPVAVVPTGKGPPHIGPSGWLFHVDAPNLLMTHLRPVEGTDPTGRSIQAHFLETSGFGGSAEFRCVRNPESASVLDGEGTPSISLPVEGDAIRIDFSANDLLNVRVDFS